MWDYQSELEYIGPDENLNLEKLHLKSMPAEKLINEYNEISAYLDELRKNEPPMKRGRKSEYRSWVSITHKFQELLDFIADELTDRHKNDPLGKIKYVEEWWMD